MTTSKMLIIFILISFQALADDNIYKLDFGRVIHNDVGEPVGFEKTNKIPMPIQGDSTLYGLVVTSPEDEKFTLNSIHVLPLDPVNLEAKKLIGKSMIIQKRGAIFMRATIDDIPGIYNMEIYINNTLHSSIEYELVPIEIAKQ
jgi:hypothetical protein